MDIFVPITGANLTSDPVKLNKRPGGTLDETNLDDEEAVRCQRDRASSRNFVASGPGESVPVVHARLTDVPVCLCSLRVYACVPVQRAWRPSVV